MKRGAAVCSLQLSSSHQSSLSLITRCYVLLLHTFKISVLTFSYHTCLRFYLFSTLPNITQNDQEQRVKPLFSAARPT